jgi:small subunit ribosomal protein S17
MAKIKIGKVTSTKMTKTVVVEVESSRPHPLYKKSVRKTKKFHVHDEIGVKVGDLVEFREVRPLSATVRWTLVRVVGAITEPRQAKPEKSTKKGKNKK